VSGAANDCERTLLVVDDDPDVREALSDALAERGYVVIGEPNGRSALEHLKQGLQPCAIVLDLMMPVMDGWDFRSEQLRDPSLAQIPVVVLSAFGPKPPKAAGDGPGDALDLTNVAFIPKPFTIETVVKAIERCCERRAVSDGSN
jgi:CheY-like chemotaxis protein